MKKWTFIASVSVSAICQTGVLANCPTGNPNEIFCDDFDTYCTDGGYPGDPKCLDTSGNGNIRLVWPRTSTDGSGGGLCGTEVKVEDADSLINSLPAGVRYPKGDIGYSTLRDWVLSPPIDENFPAGQVLDIHRFVGNVFGSQYEAVTGTDSNGLVMEFFMAADAGKLLFTSSFMELGFGPQSDPLNRANTDYALSPNCFTYCSPTIQQLPFPIMCAQGNPLTPPALPTACPPVATAPIHRALAVGSLPMTDTDPCHCGNTMSHFPQSSHLTLFDGQLWWVLRSNSPMASTGTVTARDGGPTDPLPSDVYAPGAFLLSSGERSGKSYNLVKLTIKTNTLKIECTSRIKSANGFSYDVYSVMDNIPRQYTGPFDRISGGVGAGCELDSNASWTTCKTGTDRACFLLRGNTFVDYDDFSLYGGEGYSVIGSCCHSDGTCTEEIPTNCEAPGDVPGGANTHCNTTSCCAHGTYVWADVDGDTDVDADDFGKFQLCFTGPGGSMLPDLKCECFDRGNDNHIDSSDYLEFSRCTTGANVPWSMALTPGCAP